ncbi:MAG TPA: hypothetical protein VM513_33680 [Kofleriaceae bacterium]|nr:hypothetical protein [Kofleriaceae bacterium]
MKLVLTAVLVLATGCPGGKGVNRPYPEPSAAQIVDRLAQERAARTAFAAESTMDYWLGKDRLKGTVLVMGRTGKKVRFNALSPAGGNVLADMACDGTNFKYADFQNNCQLTGPCDRNSIASLLRFEVEPEDFLAFATGTVPVIAGATGTVTWDSKNGHEKVALTGAGGSQSITIDARDGRNDVIASELRDPGGRVVWSIENTEFGVVKDEGGKEYRMPGKTRFKSPQEKADLIVDWGDRTINPTIDDTKFTFDIPAGLPMCGGRPSASAAPARNP